MGVKAVRLFEILVESLRPESERQNEQELNKIQRRDLRHRAHPLNDNEKRWGHAGANKVDMRKI